MGGHDVAHNSRKTLAPRWMETKGRARAVVMKSGFHTQESFCVDFIRLISFGSICSVVLFGRLTMRTELMLSILVTATT